MKNDLSLVYSDLKREDTLSLVKSRIESGDDPAQILEDIRQGMFRIMERYEGREYSQVEVGEGIEIYREVDELLEPVLPKDKRHYIGKIVIGEAHGDIHEMGRKLVAGLLETIGFEVFDLGADVPPEKFVEALQKTGATIMCMAAIVTNGLRSMKKTIDAVHEAGLYPKVVIGGGLVVESLRKESGADAQVRDMVVGARVCLSYVEGGKND